MYGNVRYVPYYYFELIIDFMYVYHYFVCMPLFTGSTSMQPLQVIPLILCTQTRQQMYLFSLLVIQNRIHFTISYINPTLVESSWDNS